MKQRKSLDLNAFKEALQRKQEERSAFQPAASELVRKAALLTTFRFPELSADTDDGKYLAQHATELPDGTWELSDNARRDTIHYLKERGELEERYAEYAASNEKTNILQAMLGRIIRGESISLTSLGAAELNALFRVKFWLDGMSYQLPSHDEIRAALRRFTLLERFENNTKGFRGRIEELAQLHEYVFAETKPNERMISHAPMLVYGIGGIGKSALISEFLLRHAVRAEGYTLPFVYLDFDRPGLSVSSPLALVTAALQQLTAQFPAPVDQPDPLNDALTELLATEELRTAKDSSLKEPEDKYLRGMFGASKGIVKPAFDANRKQQKRGGRSWRDILERMIRRYLEPAFSKGLYHPDVPVLIVFDSFEEAQYRTGTTEIRNLLQFLDFLSGYMSNLRLLIVGRSDLVVSPFEFTKLEVGDFDQEASLSFLSSIGVKREEVARMIYKKVGGNPLTLKLAAALAREVDAGGKTAPGKFLQELDSTQLREQLVHRNLDHIRDPDVRQLAMPGMLLRRIDPDVIREVLAEPCGLGEITNDRALELYHGLKRVSFLLEQRGNDLFFRRDLRLALKDQIWARAQVQSLALHEAAVAYYAPKTEPADRAEYLYHYAEWKGDLPADVENEDFTALRPYLESAVLHLPPKTAAYLGRQFGMKLPQAIIDVAGAQERDFSLFAEMENAIGIGEGTLDGLEYLWKEVREREESEHALFVYYRKLLALRLGLFDEVRKPLPVRSEALLGGQRIYLEALIYNYEVNYSGGLAYLMEAIKTGLGNCTDDQMYKLTTLALKFSGLKEEPLNVESPSSTNSTFLEISASSLKQSLGEEQEDSNSTVSPIQLENYEDYFSNRLDYLRIVEILMETNSQVFSTILQNQTGKLLRDIAQPGVSLVLAHDYADFLVIHYEGDWKKINAFVAQLKKKPSKVVTTSKSPEEQAQSSPDITAQQKTESEVFAQARKLIAEANEGKAIQTLRSHLETTGDSENQNRLLLLESQMASIQKREMQGTSTFDDSSLQMNRVRLNLLDLIVNLESWSLE